MKKHPKQFAEWKDQIDPYLDFILKQMEKPMNLPNTLKFEILSTVCKFRADLKIIKNKIEEFKNEMD